MKRRDLIAFLGTMLATWPLALKAQPPGKVARVGYIGTNRELPLGKAVYEAYLDEMVVNLKTAKALGLTIPQALLLRADEVIQ